MIQGSPEWIKARLGKVTASRVASVIAKIKSGGYGASRASYMAELLSERLTGVQYPAFINQAMKWGTETEPLARKAYAFHVDVDVTEVGFIEHPKIPMTGASPDGLIGETKAVEFKCPETSTHIDTLLGASLDGKYITQAMWQMACMPKVKSVDWVSFDPRLPGSMCLFIIPVKRDNAMIVELEKEVVTFLAELDHKEAELRKRFEVKIAA
jgi:putative phage-type endonuclease